MLKELEADVWMCNIGAGCYSTTEVNVDIKDKNKATVNMSGIGIVYGVTLFANHRCGSSLHFGNHRPASRQARVLCGSTIQRTWTGILVTHDKERRRQVLVWIQHS